MTSFQAVCTALSATVGTGNIAGGAGAIAIGGTTVDLGLIWSISDTCNGLMVIPNLIAVFLLSGTVFKLIREYFEKK